MVTVIIFIVYIEMQNKSYMNNLKNVDSWLISIK